MHVEQDMVHHIYIYPFTKAFSKKINKIVFQYIWRGHYEPIRRITVYRPKYEGGLANIACFAKAKTIILNTFFKNTIHMRNIEIFSCIIIAT